MKSALRRILAAISIISICLSVEFTGLIADATPTSADGEVTVNSDGYFGYYTENSQKTRSQDILTLDKESVTSFAASEGKIDGRDGFTLQNKGDFIEWQFEAPTDGIWSLDCTYYALEGSIKDIEVSLLIDGVTPFTESANLSLPRLFADEMGEDGAFERDASGNDLTPNQIEVRRWNCVQFTDSLGMYSTPYLFYLTAGTHTARLCYSSDPVVISSLKFENKPKTPTYKEYIAQFSEKDKAEGEVVRIEAENATEKTSGTLYPTYDRSNAGTYPSDPYNIRLNTIGGSNWTTCGDSISWTVDVEKEGLYELSFRTRQNYSEGMNAYRCVYINGEVPFKEASAVKFHYDTGWYIKTVGDDEPMLFYLKKGDVLTLECTSGAMDFPLREVQQAVLDLNEIYRDIIMVTGTNPSMYQDYDLEAQIPELVGELESVCERLEGAADTIEKEMGTSSTGGATIVKAVKVFRELAADTFYIPDRLSSLKGGIESLASLLLTLGGQAVELDCIYAVPVSVETPKANAGFFESLMYGLRRFFATFMGNYNSVGGSETGNRDSILVWAELGRDQAQIVNRLIEERFTTSTGIPVKLNLVSGASTLIKASLAGKGPDVALHIDAVTPVNLAARGALVDLSKFDLSTLESEIYPSAWAPFKYLGGTYGIPVTQGCELLFYRTDIFDSLGLTPPGTWDEFYRVLEVLQSKNLQVAWPEISSADQGNSAAINIFNKFLFQNGGDYYNENLSATLFDTEVAYTSFEKTVELYKTYGISREVNTFNRFRNGETPMAIASYILYTQLVASAPEIRGLWTFAPIPGTPKEDGTIDRTECALSQGTIMLKRAEKRGVDDEAFEFMKWWAGSQTQTDYGKALEGVLGIIGRTTPANRVALAKLGWSSEEFAIIDAQMQAAYNQPQVIGNYQISRSLTSAIRAAITGENTPRRALSLYNKDINDEIARKRKEFNLD